MLRSAASKVMWVGRATVFLVGLAVILALVLGLASTALAGMGVGAPFNLGQTNTVDRVSTLVNNGVGPALNLRVGPVTATPANNPEAPMRVNSQKVVTHLNADKLDGMHASELQEPRGYAHITDEGTVDTDYPSKGIAANGVVIPTGETSLYCFNLTFNDPKAAVGSPFLTNSAVVATVTPPNGALTNSCEAPHNDAAAQTYGSSDATDAAINFQVVFF
jgi:hypothetical protein